MSKYSKHKSQQKTAYSQSYVSNKVTEKDLFSNLNQSQFLRTESKDFNSLKKQSAKKSKFNRHFASQTQLISSAFNPTMYIPPHLNSSQVFSCLNSECQNWQVRPSSISKQTKKIDYDSVYRQLQRKYEKAMPIRSKLNKWSCGSKIKDQISEDRTRYQFRKPYNLFVENRSGSQMDNDTNSDRVPHFYDQNNQE